MAQQRDERCERGLQHALGRPSPAVLLMELTEPRLASSLHTQQAIREAVHSAQKPLQWSSAARWARNHNAASMDPGCTHPYKQGVQGAVVLQGVECLSHLFHSRAKEASQGQSRSMRQARAHA